MDIAAFNSELFVLFAVWKSNDFHDNGKKRLNQAGEVINDHGLMGVIEVMMTAKTQKMAGGILKKEHFWRFTGRCRSTGNDESIRHDTYVTTAAGWTSNPTTEPWFSLIQMEIVECFCFSALFFRLWKMQRERTSGEIVALTKKTKKKKKKGNDRRSLFSLFLVYLSVRWDSANFRSRLNSHGKENKCSFPLSSI